MANWWTGPGLVPKTYVMLPVKRYIHKTHQSFDSRYLWQWGVRTFGQQDVYGDRCLGEAIEVTSLFGLPCRIINRRALVGAYVPPTKLFPRLAVNKTVLKPRVDRRPTPVCGDFPDIIKFCIAAHMISEKAIRFRHPDYNPDWAQKLISLSMSRHLSTRNISFKSMHAFLSNLANRQTDECGQTHLPPLSEVIVI